MKIKAPKVKAYPIPGGMVRTYRGISEPTYRRILALVRACEADCGTWGEWAAGVNRARDALARQCEKEKAQ